MRVIIIVPSRITIETRAVKTYVRLSKRGFVVVYHALSLTSHAFKWF